MYTYTHVRIFFKMFEMTSNFNLQQNGRVNEEMAQNLVDIINNEMSSIPVAIFISTTKVLVQIIDRAVLDQFRFFFQSNMEATASAKPNLLIFVGFLIFVNSANYHETWYIQICKTRIFIFSPEQLDNILPKFTQSNLR